MEFAGLRACPGYVVARGVFSTRTARMKGGPTRSSRADLPHPFEPDPLSGRQNPTLATSIDWQIWMRSARRRVRSPHNPMIAGSNPAPATARKPSKWRACVAPLRHAVRLGPGFLSRGTVGWLRRITVASKGAGFCIVRPERGRGDRCHAACPCPTRNWNHCCFWGRRGRRESGLTLSLSEREASRGGRRPAEPGGVASTRWWTSGFA